MRFRFPCLLPPSISPALLYPHCFRMNSLCTRGRARFFLPLLFLTGLVSAQDLMMPANLRTWQATITNPALYGAQPGRVTIGLPGVTSDFSTGDLTYDDLVIEENGRRILDLDRLPGLTTERNEVRSDFDFESIGATVRFNRFAVGIHHRIRSQNEFGYGPELVELLANGNGNLVGQTVNLAPFASTSSFHEIALGGSFSLNENLYLGARVKFLSGVANLQTLPDGNIDFTTGEDNFALTLVQDYSINSSGVIDYNGLDDTQLLLDLTRVGTDGLFSANGGTAYDIGVYGDYGPFRFQIAANDLGHRIDWDEDSRNYTFNGTTTFSGIDALESILDDAEPFDFESTLDSLVAAFDPTETRNGYRSELGGTYLASAEYDLNERFTLTGIVVHRQLQETSQTGVGVGGRFTPFKFLTVGLNYNVREGDATNFGALLVGRLGPVHLVASTDDLLTVFTPTSSNRASVRLGASVLLFQDDDATGQER